MSTAAPRVWIYTDVYPPAVAGSAYMAETWNRELTALGFEVRIFAPSGTRERFRRPDQVRFKTWRDVAYVGDEHARFSTLVEVRRAEPELPDVVLVATSGRVGMLGVATATRYGIPNVLVYAADLVGATEFYSANRAMLAVASKVFGMAATSKPIRRKMLDLRSFRHELTGTVEERIPIHMLRAAQAGSSSVVMLSEKRSEQVRGWKPDHPLYIIPCGVDRLPDGPAPARIPWRDGFLRVINVGRYAPEKNLFTPLEGVAVAKRNGVDVHLVLVGEGDLKDALPARAAELGIADRVTLMGPYRRNTLRPLYDSADVFTFASVSDTQGFVVQEAAHEGLPLLVCDPKVNPVVSAGESAHIAESTPESFADAYARCTDETYRKQLGENARALALACTEQRQSEKLADVLWTAMGRPSRDGRPV